MGDMVLPWEMWCCHGRRGRYGRRGVGLLHYLVTRWKLSITRPYSLFASACAVCFWPSRLTSTTSPCRCLWKPCSLSSDFSSWNTSPTSYSAMRYRVVGVAMSSVGVADSTSD